ncbi:Protein kinase-like domain [Pseudocohnilembus persalinus]|uniref:Protein kinase-like domain n=1 Tax=Pseudocohnilembus persalinus TaxID=266149 RepID=A0A0V0QJ29_PSEPJ|nr:Protein kinase-like domain [Pseudocohnilembus persalinus]|eukprot:KRX02249.1 Protein kinase-like domain [Pseudocohnilembus persalinus]
MEEKLNEDNKKQQLQETAYKSQNQQEEINIKNKLKNSYGTNSTMSQHFYSCENGSQGNESEYQVNITSLQQSKLYNEKSQITISNQENSETKNSDFNSIYNDDQVQQKNFQLLKENQRLQDLIMDYCSNGDLQNLKLILEKQKTIPISINSKNFDDFTPLLQSTFEGQYQITKYLLETQKDININAQTSFGRTSLHHACIKGYKNILELLLQYKPNINAQDKEQCTPLHYAAQYGHEELVDILLENENINLDIKNQYNSKAHDVAINRIIYNKIKRKMYGSTCSTGDLHSSLGSTQNIEDSQDLNSNQQPIQEYSRCVYGDYLLKNSRQDRLEKILYLTKKQSSGSQKFSDKIKTQQKLLNTSEKSQSDKKGTKIDSQKSYYSNTSDKENTGKELTKSKISNKVKMFQNVMKQNQNSINLNKQLNKVGPKDFNIVQKLGQGSFGSVYLVQKKQDGKLYAMKTLRKEQVFGKNLVKYVRAEQEILSIMNHPFIVKLDSAFQTDNKLYLVMEYCPGGDLEGLLIQNGRLKESQAKVYLAEILLAIEALHKEKIVFRDLKPQNVVIDQEGHANLIDFGLSRTGVGSKNKLTSFCGSLAYLAPEMLQKQGHNFTLDYYLFGLLVYELLSGYPPYYSDDKKTLFNNIKSAQLNFPRYFSKNAKDLVTKLLKREPIERLGATNGAQEIKNHPFFSDINWEDCYNRKLKVLKPDIDEDLMALVQDKQYMKKNNLIVTFSENEQVITEKTKYFIPSWDYQNKNHNPIIDGQKTRIM